MTQASINWNSLSYRPGDTLRGAILIAEADKRPPRSVHWTLLYNAKPVSSGSGTQVSVQNASHGVYRLDATIVGFAGDTVRVQAAVSVSGGLEARATLPAPNFTGTLVPLGSVYSVELVGPPGTPETAPTQLAGLTQIVYLIPGTTHVSFALDPAQAETDGDVVVRTRAGNWALFGGARLATQDLGFGYRVDNEPVPAPADLKLQLTTEVYHVQGASHGAFSVRVQVTCWRLGPQLYRYTACPYAIHPGGEGGRQPRFLCLFTDVELELDAESTRNRFGSGPAAVRYALPTARSIPGTRLTATGTPYLADRTTGLGYTEANRPAVYEAPNLPELDAFAIAGIPGIRPSVLSVQVGSISPMVQRIKHLRGNALLYVNGAPIFGGSVVTAEVETGTGRVPITFPVATTAYAADPDTFALAGAVPIDLADFQFGQTGLVTHFTIDATAAVTPDPEGSVTPSWGAQTVYSRVHAQALNFDGICYAHPVAIRMADDVESLAEPVTEVPGCHHSSCGPQGLYCYSNDVEQPVVTVTASDANASESGDTGTFTFARTGPTTEPLIVFFTVSGSAVAGSDYQDLGTYVVFGVGAATAIKTVVPLDDGTVEPLEWVTLSLSANGAYTRGTPRVATVYITDDDEAPSPDPEVTVTASDASASEAGDPGAFTFTRTGSTASTLTVTIEISGSAEAGVDYEALSTTVTFDPGSATAVVAVTPIDDADIEDTETVIVTVVPGTGYVPAVPNVATVHIVDDDEVAPVSLTVTLEGGLPVDGWSDETVRNDWYEYTLDSFRLGYENAYPYIDGSSGDNDPFLGLHSIYVNMLKDALNRASGLDVGDIISEPGGVPEILEPGGKDPNIPTEYDGVTSPTWVHYGGTYLARPHTHWPEGGTNPITMGGGWFAVVYLFDKSTNTHLVPGRWDAETRSATGSVQVPGTPGVSYNAQVRVRGAAPRITYTGGANNGAYLQTGGAPASTRTDYVKLTVSDPPATYYLNRGAADTQHNVPIDYTVTIPAKGGAVVTLTLDNQDGFQYRAGADKLPVPVSGFPDAESLWIRLDIQV